MNITSDVNWNTTNYLDNETASGSLNDFNFEALIETIRQQKIENYYGKHYHLIFIVTCFACIMGYLTNILNVTVFSRLSFQNSMNVFLMLLAISDMVLISTQLAHIVHYLEGFTLYPFYGNYLFSMICTFLESIFTNISNWMVAVVGIWRLVMISCPQKGPLLFKPNCVKILISSIAIFSILLAVPMFLFLTYEEIHFEKYVFYDQVFTRLAVSEDHLPLKIYWGVLLLRGLVPMIIMLITTIGLVLILCRQRGQTIKKSSSYFVNLRVTIMLILLMLFFLLSNLPDSFMFLIGIVYFGNEEVQRDYRQATDIIRVFMLANNSLSFFLYYGLGFEFRSTFNRLFCKCCPTKGRDDSVAESAVVEAETTNKQIGQSGHKIENVSEGK